MIMILGIVAVTMKVTFATAARHFNQHCGSQRAVQ